MGFLPGLLQNMKHSLYKICRSRAATTKLTQRMFHISRYPNQTYCVSYVYLYTELKVPLFAIKTSGLTDHSNLLRRIHIHTHKHTHTSSSRQNAYYARSAKNHHRHSPRTYPPIHTHTRSHKGFVCRFVLSPEIVLKQYSLYFQVLITAVPLSWCPLYLSLSHTMLSIMQSSRRNGSL